MESSPNTSEDMAGSERAFDVDTFFKGVNERIDELTEERPGDADYYDAMRGFADPRMFARCSSKNEVVNQIEEEIAYEHSRGGDKDQGRIDALANLKDFIKR